MNIINQEADWVCELIWNTFSFLLVVTASDSDISGLTLKCEEFLQMWSVGMVTWYDLGSGAIEIVFPCTWPWGVSTQTDEPSGNSGGVFVL